jgi:geranylgeranyl diphosphate synthase type II
METYKRGIQAYLDYQKQHPFQGKPAELYDPANYILSLGGKRIRPVLVLLGYGLYKDDIENAMPLAHAVEVFHNFTLMHDDIMDRADVRRGQATVHRKWNDNIAILSGDMMLVKAYEAILYLNTDEKTRVEISRSFSQMAEEVCIGQQFDMNFEDQSAVGKEEYLEMIKLKTSVLLAYSLKAGAALAGAPTEDQDVLYNYGLNIGLAFQVMDDYLDTFGDSASFGKKIGGDILENKKTLLWIEAQKRANKEQKEALNLWYATTVQSQTKIDEVTKLFKSLNVDQYAQNIMNQYFTEADNVLSLLSERIDTKILKELASDLKHRQS